MFASRRTTCLLLVTAPLALASGIVRRAGAASPYRLIANPASPVASATRKFLSDAFLKKITRWPDDSVIFPVDLAPNSDVRRLFTEEIHQRSVAAVKNYWQQVIFSGRGIPPPELGNDEEVVRYVLGHSGGLGYVSRTAEVGAARTIEVE